MSRTNQDRAASVIAWIFVFGIPYVGSAFCRALPARADEHPSVPRDCARVGSPAMVRL